MSTTVNDIRIEGLRVAYPARDGLGVLALRGVDLRIAAGEVVGIAGESGCGKSTLASMLLRLPGDAAIVQAGRILFRDTDILALSERQMRDLRGQSIAMVFQDPFTALNPLLTVGRQLIDVQHRSAADAAAKTGAALAALREVQIAEADRVFKMHPHELSGGMLQRICIAMALLVRPVLLVADEPTTALDVLVEAEIVQLLRKFRETTGAAVLVVSHQLDVLGALCDRLAVMYAGQIVEEGRLGDVVGSPRHPYTRALLGCDPMRMPAGTRPLPTIPGKVSRLDADPPGCAFVGRCGAAAQDCSLHPPPVRISDGVLTRCHLAAGAADA